MNSVARPRGPLPPGTYWVRRILVLATALALVVGVNNLLSRGSDDGGGKEPDRAVRAAATGRGPQAALSGEPPGVRTAPVARTTGKKSKQDAKPKPPPLPEPEGACLAEDIAVEPVVKNPVAGRPVTLALRLTTVSTPACYWQVSPSTVTLTISSGKDHIWSSRECRRAVPTSSVVLRQTKPVWVRVPWSAKRSDADCSKQTYWALPGWYHLQAAALAGEPADVQFELEKPTRRVITREAKPDEDTKKRDGQRRDGQPSADPSGAVEPDDPN